MHAYRQSEQKRLREKIATETYEKDGALFWKSNDAPLMLDTFEDAGLPTPPSQDRARSAYLDVTLRAYKAAQKDRRSTPEEDFERRAAFGPGVTVVDVLTGRKYRT